MRGFCFKPLDFVITAILLVAGLAGLWYNLDRGGMSEQKYAAVYIDNKPVAELSLAESDRYIYDSFGAERQHEATRNRGRARAHAALMIPLPRYLFTRAGSAALREHRLPAEPDHGGIRQSPADPDRIDGVTY